MNMARKLAILAIGAALAGAAPALADVKAGVDAWARGNYDAAIREWRGPAAAGDPDAQFNMAQAYRLGRGVEQNTRQAEVLYAQAAAQGHVKAADNYGLLLFQAGRRQDAMPYLQAASDRGDPRAQYLVGIAHFNGDIVARDWVRAYALLTLANGAGLPQAPPALQQMDGFIPLAQRQAAQTLAQQLKRDGDARRAREMGAADLALGADELAVPTPNTRPAEASTPATRPSVAAAQAAIAEAARVTGTESPATAGADFARPAPPPARVASAPGASAPMVGATPAAAPRPTAVATPPPTANDGPWRVQLGAFGVAGNAERLWERLSREPALAGKRRLLVPEGRLTKLQAGGFATSAAAAEACATLKRVGQTCIVTR